MTIVAVLPRSFSCLENSHYEIHTPKVRDASERVLRDGSAGDFDERRAPPPRGDPARVGDQIVRARERFARGEEPFNLWTPRHDRPTITSNDGHERAGLNATTVSRRSGDGERRLQGKTMTTADTELSDQFHNVRRDLDSSKQEFLDAMNGYDSVHGALEAKVAEHIRKYVTATPGRAPLIREKAQEALNRIKEFSRTQTRLAESVALLRLKLDADLLAITTAEMQAAMNAVQRIEPQGDNDTIVNELHQRKTVAYTKAIALGAAAVDATRIATAMVQLRRGRLEGYVGDVLTVDLKKVMSALRDSATEQGKDSVFEQAVDATLQAAELAPILGKLAALARDVYKKIQAMRDPFTPPGDEDQMLMLATDLSDEAAINETNLKRLELILTE